MTYHKIERSRAKHPSNPRTKKLPEDHQVLRLLIDESERGADMFYATGFRAPDPFIYFQYQGKRTIVLSDLEIDRGRREAHVEEVLSWSDLQEKITSSSSLTYEQTLIALLKQVGASHLLLPASFSLGLARVLEEAGFFLLIQNGPFFPQRAVKKPQEIKALSRAIDITETGMKRAVEILTRSNIGKKNQLLWGGRKLTAELLRQEVEIAMYQAGGIPAGDSIIAAGEQACDPHERGHGPLYAHELIIIDLFPRDSKSGYYGDLTRTLVRGKATPAQQHLWQTCLEGQELALKKIKPSASGKIIERSVKDFFTRAGYPTEKKKGRWSGFFHGLGHGLGLELHEGPRFGDAILRPGHVFTMEPGLYIPGLGGVRHEDVLLVTAEGYRLLSHDSKVLEI